MTSTASQTELGLRVGVSSCLLGEEVRWNGQHKRDRFLVLELDPYVEWVPVCPEIEIGLGVPRPTIALHKIDGEVRLIEKNSERDLTNQMRRYARQRVRELSRAQLDGYVLKKDSPSCGMRSVPVKQPPPSHPQREGTGLFAEELLASLPNLPVEDEGRLRDARIRENFVERLFAHRRLRELFAGRWRSRDVVEFHTAHKLQLMAHSPAAYRELGRLVADVADVPRPDFRERYARGFMACLAQRATPGRNTNVLQHMAGYVSDELDPVSRQELADAIHEYREGLTPIVVPLVLLRHHVRRLDVEYLLGQTFLEPHPRELMLRNHV